MARELKTKPSGELRTLSGKIRLLRRTGEYLFPVELWLLNDLVNRNGWRYENVAESRGKFVGVPILTAYLNGGKTIGDGHNFQSETDENGNPAPSFTGATDERIVGAISDDQKDVRVEQADGATWIVGVGNIYAWYAKELVKKLGEYAEQGREIPVSIETLVSKSRMEGKVEVEEEYMVLGVTILGDHVTPAVAGARIAALNSMEGEFRELKMRAASYAENQSTIEKGMKTLSVFTKQQLEGLQEKFGNAWHVLAAVEDEKGIRIALRSDSYELARCDLENLSDRVTEKSIAICAATVDFGIGTNVDISAVMDAVKANEAKLTGDLEATKTALAEKESQIKSMTEIENKRRVNAAKETAKRTLAGFNANRAEKIADNAIDEICSAIECGTYTAMTDKEGLWCGDKAVEDAVFAVCARKVQEADAAEAQRQKSTFAYDKFRRDNEENAGGIDGLLAKKGIRA